VVLGADGVVRAEFDESWTSLRGVHGGYATAIAVRAAEALAPGRAVRTVAMSFLRPAEVGAAEVVLEVARHGRSITTLEGAIRQGDRVASTVRVTLTAPTAPGPANEWSSPPLDRPVPFEQCVRFTPPPMIRHFEHADVRLDPATIPGDGGEARVAGHVRPLDGRPVDAAWLAMVGDWFPPTPFRRLTPPTGGVSVDYTVHIHRLPEPGDVRWLEGVFAARTSSGGLALEHGTLASADGLLLAETFHTRWTA